MASAPTYAREIRQSAARLAGVALVTAAAVCLLAWHHHDRHIREDAVLRHYAALAAIATLEEAAQDLRSGGPPGPTGLRVARAVDRLQAAEAGTADGVSRDLMARLEASWRDVKAGGDPNAMADVIEALEAHHAAATEFLEASGPFRDGPAPWGLVLPMAALVGVGGFAAHRLVRRIARAADGQRAVEDALRAGEAGHVRAQAIAGLGHWSWDVVTGRVTRSAETYRILGRTPETLGASFGAFLEVVHPDDRDRFRATVRKSVDRQGPFDLEFRLVWPDGTVRHVHSRAETSLDPDTGEPTAMVGTVLDITDRKRAEAALVASERRFRQIFDNAPFGIALGDTRGNVIEVNAAFARFTGYRPGELRGRRFADLCHPDDLGSYHELMERAHGGATGTIERRYLRKDGATAWGRLTLGPIGDGDGPHEFAIGIVEDITCRRAMEEALKERDELLRQVMDNIEEIFWLKDGDATRFLYVSPAFETVYGRSLESVHDDLNTWLDAVHPEDRARVSADVEGALESGSPYAGSYRILRPDGTERIIQGRGYPVRDADGKVCRWAGISADVTELHRLQSALEESEDRLRQVAEFTGEVYWMNDTDLTHTYYVSPSYERVFGRTCRSLYERPGSWADGVHPEDRDKVRRRVLEARKAGQPYEIRYRIVRRDGAERSIRSRGYPMADENGVVRRWAGVAADITELHRLESALKESEERLNRVTEVIGEVFWMEDERCERNFYISPSYERVFGRSCESLREDPMSWSDAVHPEDRERVRAEVLRARAEDRPYELTYRIVRPDGAERVIRARAHPTADGDEGEVPRWVGVSADITEHHRLESALQEKEQRLREVTEHIGEVFWVSEVEGGRVTYASPAYEAVWGRPVETVYRDCRAWFEAIHPDDRPAVARTMETALAAGEPFETAYRIVRPDGTERHVRDRGHPVRDADGKVRRYVGVAADVTEQREAEEDRRRYQEELAHVTRLATMGQMASELAHEINQPLAAIANYAQGSIRRLKAGVGPGENGLLESLERIAGQADRAGDIVRHLRDLVAKGPGRRTVEDVNALVAAAVRLLEPEARRHGVRLRLDAGVDLDPVEVDRIQLDQVLINLTNNAIEALAARPGAREVVIATRGDGDGHVRVSVTDNGPGLPPEGAEARERLFGPFFTTKAHGLGMGLAISRTIVEAHGGALTAEPGPAGGAVFQFTVPVAGEGIDG